MERISLAMLPQHWQNQMLRLLITMIENQIKKLRTEQNITQEDLAAALGVSRQTVIAIEKGNYVPSLLLAMQIANHFQLPVEKIFKRQ